MAPSPSPVAGRVAFVLKGYPRLSETFIAQEILALERRGSRFSSFRYATATDRAATSVHRSIGAELLLPCAEYLYQEPRRVWHGWSQARAGVRVIARRRPLPRRSGGETRRPNRVRRFGQALVLRRSCRPRRRPSSRAFPCTRPASVARLRGDDAPGSIDGLGACQGHLDNSGLGEARKAGSKQTGL